MVGEVARSVADQVGAPSVLTSVVVYAAGAMCTRRARVGVPAGGGETTVRIGGLPPTLYEHSLRGRVVAAAGGPRVTDIRLDLGATLRRGDELPSVRLDLEDAEDRQATLRDRLERLAGEIEEVAGLRADPPQPRRGEPPRWAPVESLLALAGFVDSRLGTLHERLRATEDELAQAEHDVGVLRARLYESSTATGRERAEPSVCAVVTLALDGPRIDAGGSAGDEPALHEAALHEPGLGEPALHEPALHEPAVPESGILEIELEYHVPGATWVPTYQLRLDGSTRVGTLVLRASVAQRTGEDWSGVRLGLSTADLMRRADLPELRSLRIGRTQEEPRTLGWREPPAGLADLFAGYDSAAAARPPMPTARADKEIHGAAIGSAHQGGAASGGVVPQMAFAGSAVPETSGYGQAFSAADTAGPVPPPAMPAPSDSVPAPDRSRQMRQAARRPTPPGGPGSGAGAAQSSTASGPQTGPGPTPPPAAPAVPSADLLDYARLTIAGPDEPEARGTLRPGADATDTLVAGYRRRADTVERLARPAHAVDVRTSAGSFDYRFDTAAPADVTSDGRWHIVPVGEVPVGTEPAYVCVPSVDTAVFGTVLVTNTSPHALLAGPADVMVDGDFVRTAALPTLAPGQRQTVGIGVAESVQVAWRTHMRESTAGLRGGTTVLDHTVEVEVANRLPYPVVVEVRERVPVSTDKDVRIEEHRAEPPWEEPDEPLAGQDGSYVRGARVWRVELAPGRTRTLTGGYEVRLPAGKSVVGGNRRN